MELASRLGTARMVGLAIALIVGVVVAWAVLRPLLRATRKDTLPGVAAAFVSLALLVPMVLLLLFQTLHFRAWDLTEVGTPSFRPPPISEAATEALRDVLEPEDTWATLSPEGRCSGDGFYWLAFRMVPNEPGCDEADVELYWRREPPPQARIVRQGEHFWVVHR